MVEVTGNNKNNDQTKYNKTNPDALLSIPQLMLRLFLFLQRSTLCNARLIKS